MAKAGLDLGDKVFEISGNANALMKVDVKGLTDAEPASWSGDFIEAPNVTSESLLEAYLHAGDKLEIAFDRAGHKKVVAGFVSKP